MTYGHDRDQSSSIFSATESDTLAMIRSVSPLDWLVGLSVMAAIMALAILGPDLFVAAMADLTEMVR